VRSAAPAVPPPPAQQAFQVYFDLNSTRLTPTARSVVQQAAAKARQGQVARVTVTGHTDTTGSARYNQRLSERRAAAVKAELVRDGVPSDEIVTVGQGEQGLAVPTAAGVNEPRNRRVEIVLQSPGS
jgi:outer membrane protein OmpA-like peptidoglycan-associated protein